MGLKVVTDGELRRWRTEVGRSGRSARNRTRKTVSVRC